MCGRCRVAWGRKGPAVVGGVAPKRDKGMRARQLVACTRAKCAQLAAAERRRARSPAYASTECDHTRSCARPLRDDARAC